MKRSVFMIFCMGVFTINGFADVPGPRKSPKPTPQSTVSVTKTPEPTPAPGPKGRLAEYNGIIRVVFDRTGKVEVPVLEVRQSAVERLLASNLEGGNIENTAAAPARAFSPTQTIVSGTLFSLAFIIGGIWIFRSKGTSKTAAGVLLGTALGAGTIALANSPPPSLVTLTSRVFNRNTTVYGYAKNKVKIKLVEEMEYINGDARDDVVLIIPNPDNEGDE
jgi:hypothetical protein